MKYKKLPDFPVELAVANCDSASGRSESHVSRVLRESAEGATVVLACECFTTVATSVLTDFHVDQYGPTGSDRAGSVVAVRKTRGRIVDSTLIHATKPWYARQVRSRYWVRSMIQIDSMKPRAFSAGHGHPKRAWALWDRYMSHAPRGVLGLDCNKLKRAMIIRFPLRVVRQIGLMAAVIPRNIPSTVARPMDVDADHKTLRTTLWPDV